MTLRPLIQLSTNIQHIRARSVFLWASKVWPVPIVFALTDACTDFPVEDLVATDSGLLGTRQSVASDCESEGKE